VTAEGVEDQAILDAVAAFGCDRVQGFLIATPMPADRLALWLASRHKSGATEEVLGAQGEAVAIAASA